MAMTLPAVGRSANSPVRGALLESDRPNPPRGSTASERPRLGKRTTAFTRRGCTFFLVAHTGVTFSCGRDPEPCRRGCRRCAQGCGDGRYLFGTPDWRPPGVVALRYHLAFEAPRQLPTNTGRPLGLFGEPDEEAINSQKTINSAEVKLAGDGTLALDCRRNATPAFRASTAEGTSRTCRASTSPIAPASSASGAVVRGFRRPSYLWNRRGASRRRSWRWGSTDVPAAGVPVTVP